MGMALERFQVNQRITSGGPLGPLMVLHRLKTTKAFNSWCGFNSWVVHEHGEPNAISAWEEMKGLC